jgi:AcrR family transcriptional regulator
MSTPILLYVVLVSTPAAVTPNHRGARSREVVLDAAESLMAEHGYEAATVAALVERAGIPPSSIYHYFGSKEGVLLAVMERGARRFFAALPAGINRRTRSQLEHLRLLVDTTASTLARHPDFLRILVVMAAQPVDAGEGEVHRVVNRVRELALVRLRAQMNIVFALDPEGEAADTLSRFALAAVDGAFVACQSEPQIPLAARLQHLPTALIAVRRELARSS